MTTEPAGLHQVKRIALWLLLLALALGALALRWRGLAAQSLWLDEAMSVHFANAGPAKIWQDTFGLEPNPPLYYLALWAWLKTFGQSESAVRGLSALAGALCVLPAYGLGRALGKERAGLLAALATAASPYLVWYSQEARAFALLALLSATLLFAAHWASRHPSLAAWATWAVLATLVLYTHLYGAFSVAASALYLLVAARLRNGWLLLALLFPAVAYLPWLKATLASNNPGENWRGAISALDLVGHSLIAVVHNGVLAEWVGPSAVGAAVILSLVGLWASRWRAALLLAAAVLVPLATSYLLSLSQPIFSERYVIAIAIPCYVAACLGVTYLSRWLRGIEVVVALALIVLTVQGARAFHQDDFVKEDFRAAANHVAKWATADDVVIFVADYVQHPFAYYYRGPARLVGFTGDPNNPESFLRGAVGEARTVWLLESHWEWVDPDHHIRQWLAERYPLATEAFPHGIHLRAYNTKSTVAAPPPLARSVGASFGPLRLAAAEFPSKTVARDTLLHPPSAWLPVKLYWQAETSPTANYRPLLQLVDAKGVWGVSMVRDSDLFGKLPTAQWPTGKMMVSASDIVLNPEMPAGTYHLLLALVDESGKAAPGRDASGRTLGGPLPLGQVEVRDGAEDANVSR